MAETLLIEPASLDDVTRAAELCGMVLDAIEDDHATLVLLRRAASMAAHSDPNSPRTSEIVGATIGRHPPNRVKFLDGVVRGFDRHGSVGLIEQAIRLLGERPDRESVQTSLGLALWHADLDTAADLVTRLGTLVDVTPEDLTDARVAVLLAAHNEQLALQELRSLRPQRAGAYSNKLVQALREIGDPASVLEYLACTNHSLPPLTAAIYGFDAAWALGDVDTAVGLLRDHYDEQVHDVRLVRPLLTASEAAPWSDADLLEVWRRFETDFLSEREPNNAAALRITAAYNVLDSAADVIRFTDRLITRSDAVRTHRARALYALRRFDEAITELDELSSSQPRWDAIKLRSRIALERGDFVEALRLRDAFPDPHGQHDESLYHALLQLGRYVDAFESHESQDVRTRLRAVFGAAADVDIAAHVQRRVVIHEAGPGDEIMLAATYSALIERSEHLTISCEPRLHSLLQRSFPAIDFVPVERLRTPRLGHLHPDGPQRPRTPMFRLVDERVHEAALVANSVAAATRLPLLTLSPTWSAPTSYLTADPHRRERIAATSGTGGLGIVWRSELRSISRDIHYLSVDDLEPLLRDHDRVVCLQHDVTGPERQRLLELASGHVEFLDDIDLRNDFESTAAAVTLLDCVVGVGTTMVELAAGLGMPTVMIQPTHFGTWRATGDRRTDYWHASTVLAYADPPWDTDQLVADTTRRLAATFDMSSGGSDDDALM